MTFYDCSENYSRVAEETWRADYLMLWEELVLDLQWLEELSSPHYIMVRSERYLPFAIEICCIWMDFWVLW